MKQIQVMNLYILVPALSTLNAIFLTAKLKPHVYITHLGELSS